MDNRFIARKEHFGALIYDRQRGDYIQFDNDATNIFIKSLTLSREEIINSLNKRITPQSYDTLIQLCQSLELMDYEGRFVGRFLNQQPVPYLLTAPLKVHLSVTSECILKCKHCSAQNRGKTPEELTLDEIKQLIDEMADIGTYELVVGGGEPMLRPDLTDIIAYANSKGISVSLSTTALLVNKAWIKKLQEVKLKTLRVSFDGSTEKSYDHLRGKRNFRKALRGIKLLRENLRVTLVLHTVLLKTNISELMNFMRMVQKMQADVWSIDYIKPTGFAAEHPELLLTREDIEQAFNFLKKVSDHGGIRVELPHFPYKSPKKKIYESFGCPGGNIYLFIDAEGQVFPCSFLQETHWAGDIRKSSLKEIWLKSPALKDIRNLHGNEACFNCKFYHTCRGGCRARAVLDKELNDINAQDPACVVREPSAISIQLQRAKV